MKIITVLIFFFSIYSYAQQNEFPTSWIGNWKGDLEIYSSSNKEQNPVQIIPMEIRIQPIDQNSWTFVIDYKMEWQVPRNYELIKDTENNSWKIDEKNGIIINQSLIGNRLMSSFSVTGSSLVCSYWLENEKLNMEIIMHKTESNSTTGLGTDQIPTVLVYPVSVYQKAILSKE